GKVMRWKDVRSGFPDQPLALFGPGAGHGTYDYFTLAIVGTQSKSRGDYAKSDDGTVLAGNISGEPNALGYFGYAHYQAHREALKAVAVDSGNGCIPPSADSVHDGTYQPLSRPLFLYVSRSAAARPEVRALAQFFVGPAGTKIVGDVGYVPLPPATMLIVSRRLDKNVVGSIFRGKGSVVGVSSDAFKEEDKGKSVLWP